MTRAPSVLCGVLCAALLGTASTAAAQGANPLSASAKAQFSGMRMNKIVPPSSETAPPAPPR